MKKFFSLSIIFISITVSSVYGGAAGYIEHPALTEFARQLTRLFQSYHGHDFIEPRYQPHISVILLDFENDGRNIRIENSARGVKEELGNLFSDLGQRFFSFDLSRSFQNGDLVFFKSLHAENSLERAGGGIPPLGQWAWVIYKLDFSKDLKVIHEELKSEFGLRQIDRKTPSGADFKDFPYLPILSVGLLNISGQADLRLTLDQLIEKTGLPDPRLSSLNSEIRIQELILSFGDEKKAYPLIDGRSKAQK